MAQKLSVIIALAAFLVAWLTGLLAGVPPDAILFRSLIGAACFFALSRLLCRLAATFLDLPSDNYATNETDREES